MSNERKAQLELLLAPLPPPGKFTTAERAVGTRLRIERVYGALPFLEAAELSRAQEWLRTAEEVQRNYGGSLAWREDQARG